jgi:4'-phosphopantetheinyl transferase EntD
VIEAVLPDWATAAEAYRDPPGVTLYPAEEALLIRAVAERRAEFTTVRHCARTALGRLGFAAGAILPGPRGAPGWPAGVVGSMTHCAGYRAAVVAFGHHAYSLGIDAEPHEPLPAGVLGAVARVEERDRLAALSTARPDLHWGRLLFSAKESVYKAWSPLTGRWLDFLEASVVVRPPAGRGRSGTFDARLLVPGPVLAGRELTGFRGRYLITDELVVTAVVLPTRAG